MIPRSLRAGGGSRVLWVGAVCAFAGVLFLGYAHTPRVVYITRSPSPSPGHLLNNADCIAQGADIRPEITANQLVKKSAQIVQSNATMQANAILPAPSVIQNKTPGKPKPESPPLSDPDKLRPVVANQPVVKISAQNAKSNASMKANASVPAPALKKNKKSGKPKPEPPPLPDPDTPRPLVLGAKQPAPTACPPKLHFAQNLPKTALFSVPGCGNTWVRHLLQQATGIYTGAVYNDGSIKSKGFLGEGRRDGTVVAIKTHEAGRRERSKFQRAILIYRVPQESALAEFNRRRGGHVGTASKTTLKGRPEGEVNQIIQRWRNTNRDWIMNFTAPLHVVSYAKLKTNLTSELKKVLEFLNWEVTDAQLQCVAKHSEGAFHRKSKGVSPDNFYSAQQMANMEKYMAEIDSYFELRRKRGFELSMS